MMIPNLNLDTSFTDEGFYNVAYHRDQPVWLKELRQRAYAAYEELPMPNRSMEEWRRTELRQFRLLQFQAWSPHPEETPQVGSLLMPRISSGGLILTLNGRKLRAEVDSAIGQQGVVVNCLEDSILNGWEALIKRYLFSLLDWKYDKFAAMHAAFWTGGVFIYIPKGVKLEKPLLHIAALMPGQADLGHTLIVLDEDAEATVVSETVSIDPSSAGLYCGGIELILCAGSRLRYVNLQNWNQATYHFAHQKATVGEGAALEWTLGALGARLAKVNQHLILEGPESEGVVNGVMFAEGRQHLAYHTLQHHRTAKTKSDLLYKGALQDHSHLVWRGMIRVDPGAVRADGYQRNDNLMLSHTARTDCIPGLEILADDVRCTHGATAGCVDEEEIFYCQTRGLTAREATRLVVTGFFQQVLDRITIDSVREALTEIIQRRVREYQG
ncbi:MAG: Fe-S cluster assembly protein SufD [Thermogutta sp.]